MNIGTTGDEENYEGENEELRSIYASMCVDIDEEDEEPTDWVAVANDCLNNLQDHYDCGYMKNPDERIKDIKECITRQQTLIESLKCCGNCKLGNDGMFYNNDEGCRGDNCKDNNFYSWIMKEKTKTYEPIQ